MRLPNGYGSIVKLSGNRRRPYMVRKTIGYDKNSRQIYSILGYYATRDDALIALAHYNQEDVPVVGIALSKVHAIGVAIALGNVDGAGIVLHRCFHLVIASGKRYGKRAGSSCVRSIYNEASPLAIYLLQYS